MNSSKALFFSCPAGHGNFSTRNCGFCGRRGNAIYEIPAFRDHSSESPKEFNVVFSESFLEFMKANRLKW